MTSILIAEREQQRFDHLVLGKPRPRPESAPTGKKRKGRKIAAKDPVVIKLARGIEERVSLREAWSHKAHGTPETHEAAYQALQRPGSLARLFSSGAIDKDQLEAGDQIREAYRAITAQVSIRTANWAVRIEGGGPGSADHERLSAVRAEFAYDRWRTMCGDAAEAMISIIVHDNGLTIVARRHRVSTRRMRDLLVAALNLWWNSRSNTRRAAADSIE